MKVLLIYFLELIEIGAVDVLFKTAGKHTWKVPAGDIYYIFVGGAGSEDGKGGYNGGGAGNGGGYGGYGATDIRTASDLNSRIIIAGGSGGFSPGCVSTLYPDCYHGGEAGCPGGSGGDESANPNELGSYGGKGATQSAGGVGGYYNEASYTGDKGALGIGGNAAINTFAAGGGGGGGYYGGGGGSGTGGGGGSSYSLYPFKCSITYLIPEVRIIWAVQYTTSYFYSGSLQYFSVPADDITWAIVNVSGAQGASTSMGKGGLGAFISINQSMHWGDYFYVEVGGQNGYNGGAVGGCPEAGNGGGGSKFSKRMPSPTPTATLVYAAGGGGGGYSSFCRSSVCGSTSINGGGGGIAVGLTGSNNPNNPSSTGGAGGAQAAGGVGGYYNSSYPRGLHGIAGNGGSGAAGTCGGGGGGGYFGGGGGRILVAEEAPVTLTPISLSAMQRHEKEMD
jgi:hypothetical protein